MLFYRLKPLHEKFTALLCVAESEGNSSTHRQGRSSGPLAAGGTGARLGGWGAALAASEGLRAAAAKILIVLSSGGTVNNKILISAY